MTAVALTNGRTLVIRRQSIACAADLARPGRARLLANGHTVATGLEAIHAAFAFCSPEAQTAARSAKDDLNAYWMTPTPESIATVAQLADSQPSILRRLATASPDRHESIQSLLAERNSGDEIGWRTTGERLRDAGFVSFSLNRPAAASPDGEDRAAFIAAVEDRAAPVAGSASTPTDWGMEAVEARWRANGPTYSIKPLRSGIVSTIRKNFGPTFTIAWTDAAGVNRTMPNLGQLDVDAALIQIAKAGGTVSDTITGKDRWQTSRVSDLIAARGRALWAERFGADANPLAFANRPKRLPGKRIETPYYLRYDLTAERTLRTTEDLRGREEPVDDNGKPIIDAPGNADFGASFITANRGHAQNIPSTYAIRARNTDNFIFWLADHEYRQLPIVTQIYRAFGERSPEVRQLIADRLKLG